MPSPTDPFDTRVPLVEAGRVAERTARRVLATADPTGPRRQSWDEAGEAMVDAHLVSCAGCRRCGYDRRD